MSAYGQRLSNVLRGRFAELLRRWLGTLPAAGWAGTAADLWTALSDHSRPGEFVPAGGGLSQAVALAEPAVRSAGWSIQFRRTARARLIVFRRA